MKIVISCILLLASFACFAQINYEPGYFIDNNGNKTEGLIRNVAWKNNPAEFEYKASEDAEPQKKLKKDVSEFYVSGYKFRRFAVAIDRSSTTIDRLSDKPEPQWSNEVLYLKVLVEGRITLYAYEEQNLVKYFYSNGNHSNAEQLMYREYLKDGGIREVSTFRQQLYNLMKDEKQQKDFERLKYDRKQLAGLFLSYNTSESAATDFTSSQNKGSIHVKVIAGAGLASMEARDVVESSYNHKFDASEVFNFGAEVEYIFPFNNNKWAVFAAPYFESYSAEGTNSTYTLKAEYKSFNIPLGARHYMYLSGKSKLFINVAYVISAISGKPTIKYTAINNQTIDIGNSSGLAIGAGYSYGPISAELGYGFQRELLQYVTKGATYSTFGLIIGYKIL